MNPLVSIIIPCYNVEAFLKESLDSALAQTYSPIEVICVDNGSSDGTTDILKSYEADGKIQVLHQAIKGAPAARNMGWKASKGSWIQFLDADDRLAPEKIAHQMDLVKAQVLEPPFIAASALKGNPETEQWKRWEVEEEPWKGLLTNRLGITSANLFNRDYLEQVKGWDESLKSSQEYDLMFRIMQLKDKVLLDRVAELTKIRSGREGAISSSDIEGNKHRFLALTARICAYMRSSQPEEYAKLDQTYFDGIYERIRLNTIHGYPDSVRFFKSILPKGFKPSRTSYDGPLFQFLFRVFGFAIADSFQRLKNRVKR